ncbi:hypothetical protein CEXT_602581 [Caerostris extrusa]|uniref:Uncharacterized protein n=1 Tax=Caerostris extrusa TaxID=172846 RepID=A0AAV4UD94_CAEEX|nr:hypothetical protein CEXT_602581 [Caerostris extrusa]
MRDDRNMQAQLIAWEKSRRQMSFKLLPAFFDLIGKEVRENAVLMKCKFCWTFPSLRSWWKRRNSRIAIINIVGSRGKSH